MCSTFKLGHAFPGQLSANDQARLHTSTWAFLCHAGPLQEPSLLGASSGLTEIFSELHGSMSLPIQSFFLPIFLSQILEHFLKNVPIHSCSLSLPLQVPPPINCSHLHSIVTFTFQRTKTDTHGLHMALTCSSCTNVRDLLNFSLF